MCLCTPLLLHTPFLLLSPSKEAPICIPFSRALCRLAFSSVRFSRRATAHRQHWACRRVAIPPLLERLSRLGSVTTKSLSLSQLRVELSLKHLTFTSMKVLALSKTQVLSIGAPKMVPVLRLIRRALGINRLLLAPSLVVERAQQTHSLARVHLGQQCVQAAIVQPHVSQFRPCLVPLGMLRARVQIVQLGSAGNRLVIALHPLSVSQAIPFVLMV